MTLGKIKNDLVNIEWFEGYLNRLDEFEAIVEAGSNGLNLFFSGKVRLFLGDRLYSGTNGMYAYTVLEVPVLDVIIVDLYQIEFFWSVSEAFGCNLVFTNLIYAFTSFKDVAGFN